MKCPICRKPVEWDAPEFPFCSERCRLIDLGNWASGRYVIPGPPATPEPGEKAGDGNDGE
ncbi:MAG: DNA gyrase inhibitor YacG [Bryobacterales bacterium]|jgi:endogenous inhibitor of DNA gyrase (YacG/DUF329 family)|nr:DNA gyrase inhibitor YacG [Bryobacterales bacterium]